MSTRIPRTWGDWTLVSPSVLEHRNHYRVDLEGLTTSAQVLDWIAQVAGKQNFTVEDVGHLVRAINELLRLQQCFCGGGADVKGRR